MNYLHEDPSDPRKKKSGLFFSNRQVSWILSGFILFSFFIFIAGYFLGKKKAIEKFYQKINQESFADRIYYSVCSMYERDDSGFNQESTEEETVVEKGKIVISKVKSAEKQVEEKPKETESVAKTTNQEKMQRNEQQEEAVELKEVNKYYAELIGFGTLRAAKSFANKMNNNGFSVSVRRRKSKTTKGKTIIWYQVITEKFDNKNDLIAFVDIIKDKEKLKGIRIIQC